MNIITSASNKIVKYVRSLSTTDKKGREARNAFVAEGEKFVGEALFPWEVEFVAVSKTYADSKKMPDEHICHIVADHIFNSLCDAVHPQGILAVVRKRSFKLTDVIAGANPLVLLLEEIKDPGNLGSMLRIAHGLGCSGVVLLGNCADIYSPKVIRSSAGSIFHIPFVKTSLHEAKIGLKDKNIKVFAATAAADKALFNADFAGPTAFIIGNEARGLSTDALAISDEQVKIPVYSESLNASVASGILVYEALRQRRI